MLRGLTRQAKVMNTVARLPGNCDSKELMSDPLTAAFLRGGVLLCIVASLPVPVKWFQERDPYQNEWSQTGLI